MIIVTGAGPIGSTIAQQYAGAGVAVRLFTRSGSGPEHPLIDRRSVDVADAAAVRVAVKDATVIHHCVHASEYDADAWARELPPMEQVILSAAAEVGAVVVFPENLYPFDLTHQPVTEDSVIVGASGKPGVRARLLAARAASPARTISVVASDYFGPGAGDNAHAGDRMINPAMAGKTIRPVGDADQPHSWTYLPDLAAAMIRAAELPASPDRILMAPTNEPRTQREVATAYAWAAGRDAAKVSVLKPWLVRLAGTFNRRTGGVVEMLPIFTKPLVMDSSHSEALLHLTPTPWDQAITETVAATTSPAEESLSSR